MSMAKKAVWLWMVCGLLAGAAGRLAAAEPAQAGGVGAPADLVKPLYLPQDYPPLPIGYHNERDAVLAAFDAYPAVDRQEVLQFIYATFPAEMKRFRELALSQPTIASDVLAALVRQALELLDLKRHAPERFQVLLRQRLAERRADDLVKAVRASEGDVKAQLLKELEQVLTEVFEVKQSIMQDDLAQMKRELDELSALIEQRQRNRDSIIARRIKVLTGELDHMEW